MLLNKPQDMDDNLTVLKLLFFSCKSFQHLFLDLPAALNLGNSWACTTHLLILSFITETWNELSFSDQISSRESSNIADCLISLPLPRSEYTVHFAGSQTKNRDEKTLKSGKSCAVCCRCRLKYLLPYTEILTLEPQSCRQFSFSSFFRKKKKKG